MQLLVFYLKLIAKLLYWRGIRVSGSSKYKSTIF